MAMVHEHGHWDWHLGWTNLSVIMPVGCCTLVPMEVSLVLLLPGAIGVGWGLLLIALAMAMAPCLVCPLGLAIGGHRCGSEAGPWAWQLSVYLVFPQCGWLWAVGAPFGLGSASVSVGGGGGVCVCVCVCVVMIVCARVVVVVCVW